MNSKLKNAFTYWRFLSYPAHAALSRARADVSGNLPRYPHKPQHGSTFGAAMDSGLRWGMPESIGLRFVGWSDELVRSIKHRGWYARHDEYDEVYRGAVYQLPARDGRAIFVAGYREGSSRRKHGRGDWEDTCGEHYAALDLSNLYYAERGETGAYYDTADTALDAAGYADDAAERAAERSRDYDAAWRAGTQYADLRAELAATRVELRALVRELKAARHHTPAICKALRATVREMRREMHQAWEKAETLKRDVWRKYAEAFNEGAGETVIPV